MLIFHYKFYWNGLHISSQVLNSESRKLQHNMSLPHGRRLLLTILPSEVQLKMQPFGLQEDHIAEEGQTCEGVVFFHKSWSECHLTLVIHNNMVFLACSHTALKLEDLATDYATNRHALAEYIPIYYEALAA